MITLDARVKHEHDELRDPPLTLLDANTALPYCTPMGLLHVTVIELPKFTREALRVWSDMELEDFKAYISANPLDGELIPATGGFRKVRWSAGGKGKSGGARVIYFYYDPGHPLLLAMFYSKAVRANLSPDDLQTLRDMATETKKRIRNK